MKGVQCQRCSWIYESMEECENTISSTTICCYNIIGNMTSNGQIWNLILILLKDQLLGHTKHVYIWYSLLNVVAVDCHHQGVTPTIYILTPNEAIACVRI